MTDCPWAFRSSRPRARTARRSPWRACWRAWGAALPRRPCSLRRASRHGLSSAGLPLTPLSPFTTLRRFRPGTNIGQVMLTNLQTRDVETLVHPYTNLDTFRTTGPLVLETGKGVWVYDSEGKGYIEGMAGL